MKSIDFSKVCVWGVSEAADRLACGTCGDVWRPQ